MSTQIRPANLCKLMECALFLKSKKNRGFTGGDISAEPRKLISATRF